MAARARFVCLLCLLIAGASCGGGSQSASEARLSPRPSATVIPLPSFDPDSPSPGPDEEPLPTGTPVRPVAPGTPTPPPRNVVLAFDGVGAVAFGAAADDAVSTMSGIYGPPDEDSGWIDAFSPFGTCPGSKVRGVEWHGLRLLFTDGETAFGTSGTRHFFSYDYFGDDLDRSILKTAKGITIGSSVPQIRSAYPEAKFDDGPPYDATVSIGTWPRQLFGFLDRIDEDGTLEALSGGQLCGE